MMMMALRASKPSISTSSWLSVCSRSSWLPTGLWDRTLPSASSSSMKTMHGALASAWTNRSRTRAAPTPTNISTNSEPLRLKNGTLASPATARASSVLPVPGGPTSSTPLGMRPPSVGVLLRVLQELDDLAQLLHGLVDAGDVLEGDLDVVLGVDLGLAAGEGHDAALAAHPPHQERPQRHQQQDRHDPAEELRQPAAHHLAAVAHLLRLEVGDQGRVLDADRRERGGPVGLLQRAADGRIADDDLGHLPGAHQRLELAVGHRLPARREQRGLRQRDEPQPGDDQPDRVGAGGGGSALGTGRGRGSHMVQPCWPALTRGPVLPW